MFDIKLDTDTGKITHFKIGGPDDATELAACCSLLDRFARGKISEAAFDREAERRNRAGMAIAWASFAEAHDVDLGVRWRIEGNRLISMAIE